MVYVAATCTVGRSKTPTRGCADRFIPNRSSTDYESAHYRASQTDRGASSKTESTDPVNSTKEEYERVMSANLNGNQPSAKILAFRQKAPAAPEGSFIIIFLDICSWRVKY